MFRKALALEPEAMGAHFNLGMALREKGDFDAALNHLRRVVEADPGNCVDALRARTDTAAERRPRGSDRGVRTCARDQSRAARGLLRARRRAEAAERHRAEGPLRRHRARQTRQSGARRRRSHGAISRRREMRSPTRSSGTPIMPRRTRCRDTCSASRATWPPRFRTCSGPRSFVRNRPRHGTTSARPSGTAARERRRLPNCARACGSIRGRQAGTPFSAWRCSRPAISPVPARACSARWRCHPRWRPLTSISASPSCGRGIWKRVLGSSKPG